MLIIGILLLILSNAVTLRRDKSILYSRSAMIIMLTCIIISFNNFHINFIDQGIGLFSGTYISTVITHIFHIFLFIITLLILQLNSFYPRKIWTTHYSSLLNNYNNITDNYNRNNLTFVTNNMSQQYRILEYPLIIMFALTGGIFLISSGDLISVFVSIELQSYALYILCALYRNSERPLSGALVYFLLGGLSSCLILLAISLLYINSGHTNFDSYYIITNISEASNNFSLETTKTDIYNISQNNNEIINTTKSEYSDWYKNFSLAVLSVGLLFKISAAPFHFWSPDVYDAVPTIITTFISIFAKISIFILLLELVHFTSNNFTAIDYSSETSISNLSWTYTLLISSLFSLIIGSILGLTQFRVKRLYAYSTISHLGFILLALTINSIESIQSFIFYLMQYSLSNLNAFLLLIGIGYTLYLYVDKGDDNSEQDSEDKELTSYAKYTKEFISDKDNSPVQLIKEMKGYFHINPFIAVSLAITLFSFVGIPPLIGFFAKQMVLISAIDSGYMFMVFVAILTSVISACYYLVFIKEVFFYDSIYKLRPEFNKWNWIISQNSSKETNEGTNEGTNVRSIKLDYNDISLNSFLSTTISMLTLMILTFILIPQEWLNMTTIITLIFFNC